MKNDFIKNIKEIFSKKYSDSDYELNDFVKDIGYSKTYVNQKTKELMGLTIGQFMKNYRLHIAKRIMEESHGDFIVASVAYDVGFADPKYFSKCFKALFGFLPSTLQRH